ncbi:MAG: hypothetical protein LKE46_09790 [Clostridium sp.]|jgi:hypothetical protein|uniref:hypothetical protein n=1 Tax=Clostridium sp. TaxID=1506 RepID=UPI0025B89EF6|nr:hypothetical protein [Clostridium sp.]MCH3964555.1 hypothetical protein [Clostridium sp.]MCI1715026.1 hypothetical protein [Clostridium sp.]MCI1799288.1 hypothetical protein [Clostridium sp.]MCI1813209.1 hypothetical protein [Clostridium sp.]MCI1870100.1 hypothetical protein [Clostridium sp.]
MAIIEKYKLVQAFEPRTTNAAITSNYITLKNSITATVVVNLAQTVGHTTQVSLYQAQDIEGTGAKPLSSDVPILANEDVSASDILLRQADGVSYTVVNTAKNKQVIFHVDPAKLDINNGFTCLNVRIGASSQATNFASGEFILENKYAGDEKN